ncbi:MAG: T9SS type A sorting domain-containing protein [Candidatus Marinimicrobia bacterium]|nr:T9SS type A sorting domain-containing protein [Candidatus Neomarinimicrobiota bacterium]
MNQAAIFILTILLSVVYPQENIFVTIEADTVTIWHTATTRNCCSLFDLAVQVDDSIITVTEVDTGDYCYCECLFDLSVSIAGLNPGNYTVEIFGTDSMYQIYWGSTSFALDSITTLSSTNSGCVPSRDDTSFIELTVEGDNLELYWDTPLLNCCLEEVWGCWLVGDTFFVTMTDTGAPCDCECPFELNASFGPFSPGTYILDFWYGEYGYPLFTIGDTREGITIIHQEQSDCYYLSTAPETATPENFILYPAYPNPFNSATVLNYYLSAESQVTLSIFDLRGREIMRLIDTVESSGPKRVVWNGLDVDGQAVSSGVYICRLLAGAQTRTQKLVLLR